MRYSQILLTRVIEEDQKLIIDKAKTKTIKLALIKNQRTLDECSRIEPWLEADSQHD